MACDFEGWTKREKRQYREAKAAMCQTCLTHVCETVDIENPEWFYGKLGRYVSNKACVDIATENGLTVGGFIDAADTAVRVAACKEFVNYNNFGQRNSYMEPCELVATENIENQKHSSY